MKNIVASFVLSLFLFNFFFPLCLFAAEPSTSTLIIISNIDGAKVYLDSKDTGIVTPAAEPIVLDSGYHMIRMEKEGFSTWRKDIFLSPGEEMKLETILLPLEVTDTQKKAFKNMDKKPIHKRWWFWVIVLAGVGTAIANSDASGGKGAVAVSW